jgi:hypothetical protein
MSLNHPYVSEGYAPAYQISATPFVTSSVLTTGEIKQISLDYVSKSLTIKNTGGTGTKIAMAFTLNGLKPENSNFFDIVAGDTPLTLDLRTTEIFLSASAGTPSFSFLAGCTSIHKMNFTTVTGSNGYQGVG